MKAFSSSPIPRQLVYTGCEDLEELAEKYKGLLQMLYPEPEEPMNYLFVDCVIGGEACQSKKMRNSQ